jgi:hypothetical protein
VDTAVETQENAQNASGSVAESVENETSNEPTKVGSFDVSFPAPPRQLQSSLFSMYKAYVQFDGKTYESDLHRSKSEAKKVAATRAYKVAVGNPRFAKLAKPVPVSYIKKLNDLCQGIFY